MLSWINTSLLGQRRKRCGLFEEKSLLVCSFDNFVVDFCKSSRGEEEAKRKGKVQASSKAEHSWVELSTVEKSWAEYVYLLYSAQLSHQPELSRVCGWYKSWAAESKLPPPTTGDGQRDATLHPTLTATLTPNTNSNTNSNTNTITNSKYYSISKTNKQLNYCTDYSQTSKPCLVLKEQLIVILSKTPTGIVRRGSVRSVGQCLSTLEKC